MSRFCSECGNPLAGGARFCRACGQPAGSGTDATEPEPTVAGTPFAQGPPPVEPAARTGGNGPFIAIVALVAIAMLAGGGVAAYMLLGDDAPPSEADWAGAWSETDGGYGDDGSSDGYASGGETGTDASDGDGDGDAGDTGAEALAAELEPGLYVQLGSFLGDGATREAERLRQSGIDAFVVDSDDVAELLPAFNVVVAGPLEGASEQRQVLRDGRKADIAGLVKTLTPATAATSESAVAGASFEGELQGPEANADVTIGFDDSGRSGWIDYGDRRCEGELSLTETTGAVLAYDHRVSAGRCPRDGTLAVKPIGDEIRVTWRHATTYDFMGGTLTAAGA